MNIASQYESCASASEDYQNALNALKNATDENRDSLAAAVKETEEHLETMIQAEEACSKYGLEMGTLTAQAKEIAKAEGVSEKQAMQMAIANERMNRGVANLVNNWKDWKKILTSTDKTAEDYAATLADLSEAVTELVGWYEDLALDSEFVEQNMGLIDKAAEGDTTAIMQLGAAVAQMEISAANLNTTIAEGALSDGGLNAFQQWADSALDAQTNFDNLQTSLSSTFGLIQSSMDQLANGASLQDVLGGPGGVEEFVNQLNAYAAATGMTAQEMQDMLSSIGVTAHVESDYQEQEMTVPTYREQVTAVNYRQLTGQVQMEDGSTQTRTTVVPEYTKASIPGEPLKTTGFVEVASIKMEGEDGSGAAIEPPQFTGRQAPSKTAMGGGTGNKGGGGSGGGSGNFSKKSPKKDKGLNERYKNIESSIDKTSRAMQRYSDAADDAWGAAKYRNLKAINNQLQIQAKKLQILQKEAEDYYVQDRDALQDLLKQKGITSAIFNSDGFVANRENILKQLESMRKPLEDEYNRLVNQYNAGGVANEALEEAISAAEEKLTEFAENYSDVILEALDQVDETAQKKFDVMQERLENIRQWMSNKVEMAGIKLEIGLAIDDTDIRVMNHLIDLWGDLGTELGKTWKWYNQIVDDSLSKMDRYMSNASRMNQILENINPDGTVSLDGMDQSWFENEFGKDAWEKYINGNGGLPAEVIDQLQEDVDSLMDALEEGQDALRSMLQEWVKLFEMYMEKFDKISDKIAASNETLDMYTNLMTAMGKDQTAAGAKTMLNIAKATYANAKATAEVAKAKMQTAKQQLEEQQARLDDFLGGRAIADLEENEAIMYQELKNWVDTAEEAYNDAASEFKSGVSEMASAFTAEMEAATNAMRAAIIEDIGSVFTDWDTMLEMYGMKKEQNQWWLDLLTKDYELDKLGSSIQNYMDENSQLDTLGQYQELLDEVNSLLGEGVEMNQTDLEVLQKKFELMQAQDAYEEAMNNKNTMRLTRDASGNYSYVYSGDDNSKNAAEQNLQKVKDLTYEIEKLQQDAAAEAEELWLNTYARIMQLDEERNTARYQNDEQYRKYIDEQLAIEEENLERYANEISKRYDAINKKFTDSELYWLMGEQELEDGTKLCLDNMDDYHNWFVGQHREYARQLDETGKGYVSNFQDDVKDIGEGTEELGGDWTDLEDVVNEKTDDMIEEDEALADAAWDLEKEASKALSALATNLDVNARNMVSRLKEVTAAIYEQIEALQKLRAAQLAEMEKADSEPDEQDSPDDYVDPNANAAPAPAEEKTGNDAERGRLLNYSFTGNSPNRTYYADGVAVGTSKNYTRDAQIIQALINAGVPPAGKKVTWTVYHPDSADNVFKKFGLWTGGLVSQRGTYELAEKGPELVLNNQDTENILAAVANMRQLVAEKALALGTRNLGSASLDVMPRDGQVVQQQVQIDATFPNVSVAAEVEEALNNLLRQVAQYNIDR